jgi:hypothetical protein
MRSMICWLFGHSFEFVGFSAYFHTGRHYRCGRCGEVSGEDK